MWLFMACSYKNKCRYFLRCFLEFTGLRRMILQLLPRSGRTLWQQTAGRNKSYGNLAAERPYRCRARALRSCKANALKKRISARAEKSCRHVRIAEKADIDGSRDAPTLLTSVMSAWPDTAGSQGASAPASALLWGITDTPHADTPPATSVRLLIQCEGFSHASIT
jgi:hypothetical protein